MRSECAARAKLCVRCERPTASSAGARRARCRCLRQSLPLRLQSRLAYRSFRRFSRVLCRSSRGNNRQSDLPPSTRTIINSSAIRGEQTHKTQRTPQAAGKQPDRRAFAQLVSNMAEIEAVLLRKRTDDSFWQVARGPLARSFIGMPHADLRVCIIYESNFHYEREYCYRVKDKNNQTNLQNVNVDCLMGPAVACAQLKELLADVHPEDRLDNLEVWTCSPQYYCL